MLNTSQWPEIYLDILKDVRLDPKNVRLEVTDAQVEADIIEDLFANEDALGLVEELQEFGYLTHETPVVLKRRGKYVMIEGNRRLAALKAIQNPMLVPDYQARIAAFATLLPDRQALAKIRVMLAPSQTEADQLTAAIHTGNLRRAWTPGRQAAFFQAQIDAGRTLKELLARYPTIDVRRFVLRARIINLFKSVPYDDTELRAFLTTRQWAKGLSTLARIYESKAFMALTGISMDTDGILTMSVPDSTFNEIATAIVRGMHDGNINTRSLNSVKSPRYTQLLVELQRIVAQDSVQHSSDGESSQPHTSSQQTDHSTPAEVGGSATSARPGTSRNGSASTAPNGEAPPSGTNLVPPPSSRGRRKKQKNLDLGQVKAPDCYPEALKLLLGELSEIDVQKFPNATFLMMRAALEKSIKSFADAKLINIKGTGNSEQGRVQLGHALNWLFEYVKANGPRYLRQVIEDVRTGRLVTYANTKDSLDAVNHNHHFKVDPDQAIAMWSSIDSIMRYLMKP